MDLMALHFIRPAWLIVLPMALAVPMAWRLLRRPSGDWARICDDHLLRWLSVGEQGGKSGVAGSWVAGLVLATASLALAGPSWERLPDTSYTATDERVLLLDLSASMLAQDLKPDRLTQVRYRLSDVLELTQEGQVGMVAYAGNAHVVSPLTSDTNTIANMLPALRPDIMPVAGSRADRGMELAAELLRRSGAGRGEILLVTDSATAADADYAARLRGENIRTSVLAVGTPEGAPIPSGNGFVSDAQGNVVIARTNPEALAAVARAGGGRFSRLVGQDPDDLPWAAAKGEEFSLRDDGLGERWRDLGPWLVLLLLPPVAFGFRRGLLFLAPLVLMPALAWSPPAHAGLWDDLWQRRDQQARQALDEQRPGEAAALAQNPAIAGEAWYRNGDYQRAASQWAQAKGAEAHYNRGNALAQAGDYDGALAAYDEALARQPDLEDALFNRALVEQLRDQERQQQAEDESGEGDASEGEASETEQQGEQGEEQSEGEQQSGEGEAEEQEGEQGEQGQPGQEQMAQAWSEEDAQAMEQWLRRIPDDPGGLLRRKFRNEHQRRGAPADEKETW